MLQSNIESFLDQLKSIPFVQNYLKCCYQKRSIKEYDKLSYQNTEKFIYYLEHGETFFQQAQHAPIPIKPILLFYGLNQLIKACLVTTRPNYPENTKLLAHGVSARKRKKQSYRFLFDEVKIQQYGLFPYFSNHLFAISKFPTDKISMDSLLIRIPELKELSRYQNRHHSVIPVGQNGSARISIPKKIITDWHITEERFVEKIKAVHRNVMSFNSDQNHLILTLKEPLSPFESGLFYLHIDDNKLYFCTKKQSSYPFHELMNHYVLLYNLSMICRYETEWWGELLHTFASDDYSYIIQYLKIAEKKVKIIIGYFLLDQWEKGTI